MLLSGGYILQRVEENLTYDFLHSSEDNLWSILYLTGYLTGYLTRVRQKDLKQRLPEGVFALMIPNREIKEIFETKYSKTLDSMEDDCNKAIKQINERMYAEEYEDSCDEILCYGISFYKKRCLIRKK